VRAKGGGSSPIGSGVGDGVGDGGDVGGRAVGVGASVGDEPAGVGDWLGAVQADSRVSRTAAVIVRRGRIIGPIVGRSCRVVARP
jgi:hypothetical protein